MQSVVVASFYKFVSLESLDRLQAEFLSLMEENSLGGTILLAEEGINGTIAGSRSGIDIFIERLYADARFDGLNYKEAYADSMPFNRSRVKLKKEIVTMGIPDIDPNRSVGTYIDPEDWNALISDSDVLLIDARNDYEVRIGTFQGAINPRTGSFRELPGFLDEMLGTDNPREQQKKVAMFCTGGIRCEKSTAYLKEHGFSDVYHLRGGILKYLESIPESESMWDGECFVFDERVAVNHDLDPGSYQLCRACRMPLSKDEMSDPAYVKGVSCPHCIAIKSEEDRERYRERERQVALALARGNAHIGSVTESNSE